jgi:hypothetical protein
MLRVPAPHAPAAEWEAFLDEAHHHLIASSPLSPEQFLGLARLWATAVPALDAWRGQLDRMKTSRHFHAPDEEPASLEAIAELEKRYSRLADVHGRCLVYARTAFPGSPNHPVMSADILQGDALAIARRENKRGA